MLKPKQQMTLKEYWQRLQTDQSQQKIVRLAEVQVNKQTQKQGQKIG